MKVFLSLVGLLCSIALSGASASISAQTTSDPFEIDRGTSFAASAPKPRAATNGTGTSTPAASRIVADVRQVLEIIRQNHVSGSQVEDADLTKSSINAMLETLDPHSTYFDADEFNELLGEQDSEYSGTGSTIANFERNGKMETYVLSTHPDSSAAKANLQYGDRIIAVDGAFVSGLSSDVVRNRVRGPRGTNVRITIERAESGKVETIEMRRDRVFQPTIPDFFLIRDGVGYVDLTEGFSHTTGAELEVALKELHRRGMTSLILDLRGNTGGILDQAVKVAERFLPAGSGIISQRGRGTYDNREWRSENRAPEKMPLVVLVDGHTASASEVVAGALQDNDRALIVGQNTFGKGLVQNVVELPMGGGLTITTARYYTPSGRSIQRSYDEIGMYDYYNHRMPEQRSGSKSEAHTMTNRVVYGGNGIAPDETFEDERFDAERAHLLDPIFFYVREMVNRRSVAVVGAVAGSREEIRQSIIFGQKYVGPELMVGFRDYASKGGWNLASQSLSNNEAFVTRRLNYEFALAAFGPSAAKRAQIENDLEVAKAIGLLPKAALLAAAADQTRTPAGNKKARRVASPTGQGRNRRN